MASKKKKIQITVELKTREELNEYLQPTYPKVVVVDAYHPFWGRCEVAEIMLKKFQEEPANANKVDWVSIPYEQIEDIVPKEKDESGKVIQIGAKPKYYIFVKGEFFSFVNGIDLPKLKEEINKSYAKFEESAS